MDAKRCGALPCPYCDFAISKDLIGSSFTLSCPQCGRALKVSRKFLVPLGTVIAVVAVVVWFCVGTSYGLSAWWYAWVMLGRWFVLGPAVMILIAIVSLFLPRELVPRSAKLIEEVTTLDLTGSNKPESDA